MVTIPAPMHAPQLLYPPFSSDEWLYEIKHDGYRCMAAIEPGGSVTLRTKSGADCTAWFPEVVQALAQLPGGPHIIDGEACVLREDGTSDFNLLQERARRRRLYPGAPQVTLCAFDLLMLNGRRLLDRPLMERKTTLANLLEDQPKTALLYLGHLPADERLFQAMLDAGLMIEGVMAKRKDSTYQPGVRSPDWRKVKRPGWQEGRNWKG